MKKLSNLLWVTTICASAFSQSNSIEINAGAVRTELKNGAFNYAVKYAKDVLQGRQYNFKVKSGHTGFFTMSPEVNSQDGSEDAFSSVDIKISGFACFTKVASIPSVTNPGEKILIPDLQHVFHVIPFSFGMETNSNLSFINGILEAGYFPYYWQASNNNVPNFLKYTRTAIFMQTGYKFKTDNLPRTTGGSKDESKEPLDNAILRTKFIFQIDTKDLLTTTHGQGIGIIGNANLWYDYLNSDLYYNLEGKLRIYLSHNYHFDLSYQKGSGAPNFNKGDQFGASLGISF